MRKLLLTLISAVALASLAACGGSSNSVSVPAGPSGGNPVGFTNASLTGNYVFAVDGINNTKNFNFAVAGVFTADGSGHITSGARDTVNDAGGQTLNEFVTGTYNVNQDGRGLLILSGSSGQAIYLFVLSSSSAGQLFQNGTGSSSVVNDAIGRIEAQSAPSTTLAGTYIFRFDGEDINKSPYGAVGGLTASGNTLTGSIDENDAGIFSSLLPVSAGSYTLSANGRGAATYATLTGPNTASHNFIVYYVSPTRLELVSTDPKFWLHGYADLQTSFAATNATFIGPQIFNLSGLDNGGTNGSAYPIVETGRLTLDGLGNATSATKDYNEASAFYSPTFAGTYNVTGAAANGRWTSSLNTFSIGPIVNENLVGWQVSPQQSLVLVTFGSSSTLGTGYAIVETGDMRAQTIGLSNASITGNYAQFLSGFDIGLGYFESSGNYLANGAGILSGTIDYQTDSAGLTENSSQSGSYSVDPTLGRGTATVSGVPVIFYTLNADTIYLIASDGSSAYQGTLTLQTP